MDDPESSKVTAVNEVWQAASRLKEDGYNEQAFRSLRSAAGRLVEAAAAEQLVLPSESSGLVGVDNGEAEWVDAASGLVEDEIRWARGLQTDSTPNRTGPHRNLLTEIRKLNRNFIEYAHPLPGTDSNLEIGISNSTKKAIKKRLGIKSSKHLGQRADYTLKMRLEQDTKAAEDARFDAWTRPTSWGPGQPQPATLETEKPTVSKAARRRTTRKRPFVGYEEHSSVRVEGNDRLTRGLHVGNNSYRPESSHPNFLVPDSDYHSDGSLDSASWVDESEEKDDSRRKSDDGGGRVSGSDDEGSSGRETAWNSDDEDLSLEAYVEDISAPVEHPEGTQFVGSEPDEEMDIDEYSDDGSERDEQMDTDNHSDGHEAN